MMKKASQRHLIAPKYGQPAFLQKTLNVKCTFMCIIIKSCRFAGFFQHICLPFYATFRFKSLVKLYCSILLAVFIVSCAAPPPVREEQAIEKDPFQVFPEKYRIQAIEWEKKEELRKALFSWQVVIRFIPDDEKASERIKALQTKIWIEADRHFQLGLDHFRNNSIQAARKEFLIALTYNPDHEQAFDYLKNKLIEPDYIQYEVTVGDTLRRIASDIYHDPEKDFLITYFNDLGNSNLLKPGITLKLPIIETAPTSKPPHSEEMLNKARSLFEAGEYQKALYLSEKILEYAPSNRGDVDLKNASYYELGTILLKKKEYQKSLKMFKNVDPLYKDVKEILFDTGKNIHDQAEDHYAKGVRYFLAEELDKAIKEWGKTLRLDPEHSEAKRDIEKARRLLENLKKFQ